MHTLALLLLSTLPQQSPAEPIEPGAPTAPTPLGKQMAHFQLKDYLGTEHRSTAWSNKRLLVVAFLGAECPLAKLYGQRLAELATQYEPRGVAFVGIDANRHDSLAELAHFARRHQINFPLLKDPGNRVADQFGAERTPEVFVLDPQRIVRYWGRIDDQYGVGYARPAVTQRYMGDALDELLAGKPVSHPTQPVVGCLIGRVSRKAPGGDITYTKHIAKIVQERCVSCHRSGQIAPFELTEYQEVLGWAETIREVIQEGRMPPWHADPAHGRFSNDARMTDDERRLIYKWVDNGCPQGNLGDLPKPLKFVEGWQISKPDLIVRMPKAYKVQAKGTVPYQYFIIDPKLKKDTWIKSAEARPGNRAVVHHLVLFFHPPGKAFISPEEPLLNVVAAFAPGMPANITIPGLARRVPAGSKLIFQVHYTPNGSPQTDLSDAGLVFADPAEVRKEVQVSAAVNFRFSIPPGAAAHRVTANYTFREATTLHYLLPHMHLRGKSFRFEAIFPDESYEVLLDVPRYDFNWQNAYVFEQPKLMPAGSRLKCVAHYDNSPENLVNPDASAVVTWGDQTWEEMMVGSFGMSLAEQDLRRGPPRATPVDSEFAVVFRYQPSQPAKSVYLAGSFNDWKPRGHRMDGPDANGLFTTRIRLPKGKHEYKFVIDGEHWKSDPGNRRKVGDYGNSLLTLGEER